MKKNRWLLFFAIFFLVQYLAPPEALSEPSVLLPQDRMGADPAGQFFKQLCESICMGLAIYKLDAVEGYPKDKLSDGPWAQAGSRIRFDMDNINIGKKGWTRHYPFSIGDKSFIMRIFLTKELRYQPEAKVLYEGRLENPAVTFQILPSLNEMLSDCKITPFKICPRSPAERSS